MDILLNGASTTIPDQLTIAQLLDDNGLASRRVAIEVNGTIVPRSDQAARTLQAGDRVEIVHALGGG
jgi:sulfur carrier protein